MNLKKLSCVLILVAGAGIGSHVVKPTQPAAADANLCDASLGVPPVSNFNPATAAGVGWVGNKRVHIDYPIPPMPDRPAVSVEGCSESIYMQIPMSGPPNVQVLCGVAITFGSRSSDTIAGFNGLPNLIITFDGDDKIGYAPAVLNYVVSGTGKDQIDFAKGSPSTACVFGGQEDDVIAGGLFGDLMSGDEGDDVVLGSFGDDFIFLGSGHDIGIGAGGNDHLDGGSGTSLLTGDDGNDLLLGSTGTDRMLGGEGDDVLVGRSGDDSFKGEGGADILNACDASNDDFSGEGIMGGPGGDVFQLDTPPLDTNNDFDAPGGDFLGTCP